MVINVPIEIKFQCESRLKLSKTVTNAMCQRDCDLQALAFLSQKKVSTSRAATVDGKLQTYLALAEIPLSALVYQTSADRKTVRLNIFGFKKWSHTLPFPSHPADEENMKDSLAQQVLIYFGDDSRSSQSVQSPLPLPLSLPALPSSPTLPTAASVVSASVVSTHSPLVGKPTTSPASVVVAQPLSWVQEVQQLTAKIEQLPTLNSSKESKSREVIWSALRERVCLPWLQEPLVNRDVTNYERLVELISRLSTSQLLPSLSRSNFALMLMIALRAPAGVDIVNAQRWLRTYGSTSMWDSHYPSHPLWAVLHEAMRLTMANPMAPEPQAHCDAFVLMLAAPIVERWVWGNQHRVPLALWCGLCQCVETIGYRLGVPRIGTNDPQPASLASQHYSRKMRQFLSTDLERHWLQVQALYSLQALPLDSTPSAEAPPADFETFAFQMNLARATVTQTFQDLCTLNAHVPEHHTATCVAPQHATSISIDNLWPVSKNARNTHELSAFFLAHEATPSFSASLSNFFVGQSVGQSFQFTNAFDSEHNMAPVMWPTRDPVSPMESPALACLARVAGVSVHVLGSAVMDVQAAARVRPDDTVGAYGSLWFGLLLAQARDYPSLTRPCANFTTLLHNPQWQALLAAIALPTSASQNERFCVAAVVAHHTNMPFSSSSVDATLSVTLQWLAQMHLSLPSPDSVSQPSMSAPEVLFLLLFVRTFAVWHRLWNTPLQPLQQQLVAQVGVSGSNHNCWPSFSCSIYLLLLSLSLSLSLSLEFPRG